MLIIPNIDVGGNIVLGFDSHPGDAKINHRACGDSTEINYVVAGETDYLKQYGMELLECFVDPVVIHHPKGHTIPRLGNLL